MLRLGRGVEPEDSYHDAIVLRRMRHCSTKGLEPAKEGQHFGISSECWPWWHRGGTLIVSAKGLLKHHVMCESQFSPDPIGDQFRVLK